MTAQTLKELAKLGLHLKVKDLKPQSEITESTEIILSRAVGRVCLVSQCAVYSWDGFGPVRSGKMSVG